MECLSGDAGELAVATKSQKEPETAPGSAEGADELSLEAALSPAQAGEVREKAIAAIEAAVASGANLRVNLDSDTTSPTALQMLVATVKTAEARGVGTELAETASAVLARVENASTEEHAE